jgi:hypothetical protein
MGRALRAVEIRPTPESPHQEHVSPAAGEQKTSPCETPQGLVRMNSPFRLLPLRMPVKPIDFLPRRTFFTSLRADTGFVRRPTGETVPNRPHRRIQAHIFHFQAQRLHNDFAPTKNSTILTC